MIPFFNSHVSHIYKNIPQKLSLVDGFNPLEKYQSYWILDHLPGRGENKQIFQTTT